MNRELQAQERQLGKKIILEYGLANMDDILKLVTSTK